MKSELYLALKRINIERLDTDDKLELLKLFMITKSSLIRNEIAFIFADIQYDNAIPYILKKINQKDLYNKNGSLVFALTNMDTLKYFRQIIKILCDQGYEARLLAYSIIEKNKDLISKNTIESALKDLEKYEILEDQSSFDKGENSRLHFIERTKKLLQNAKSMRNQH
jgi:hypothetical protein